MEHCQIPWWISVPLTIIVFGSVLVVVFIAIIAAVELRKKVSR